MALFDVDRLTTRSIGPPLPNPLWLSSATTTPTPLPGIPHALMHALAIVKRRQRAVHELGHWVDNTYPERPHSSHRNKPVLVAQWLERAIAT